MRGKADNPKREKLRELLNKESQRLCDRALEPEYEVAEEDVEKIERIERIIKMIDAYQRSPLLTKTIPRWAVAGCALAVALCIVSILVFTHVPETYIELDLELTYAGFVTPKKKSLVFTDALNLERLGISGLRGVMLSGEQIVERKAIQLSKNQDATVQISLATVKLPPSARVELNYMDAPNHYQITLTSPLLDRLNLVAHADGEVLLSGGPGLPVKSQDLSVQSLRLIPDGEKIVLELAFMDASQHHFSPQLPVSQLFFEHTEGFPAKRLVSTILNGVLCFESLNGKRRMLRPGEFFRLTPVEVESQIRTIQLEKEKIVLQFGGKVSEMCVSSRSGTTCRTLMPTRLESLIANRPLGLLWGATGVVFTLIISVLKKFEVKS